MELEKIITNRKFANGHFYQIVYEWESQIVQTMHLSYSHNLSYAGAFNPIWSRLPLINRLPLPTTFRPALGFVIVPDGSHEKGIAGKTNVLPVIIDFWISSDSEFVCFQSRFSKNPGVLISSKEVYEIVLKKCPGLRVFHWGLSIPDKYICDRQVKKRWDCAVVGRPNRVLNEWMLEYAGEHPDFTYVYNDRNPTNPCNYVASTGEVIGDAFKTRDSYFEFLSSVRVGLYSTPSMDESRRQYKGLSSNNYNQVTPRFLEYLAANCHVLARYPTNADTEFYEMNKVSPHIETYDQFRERMDWARLHDVDRDLYISYLRKHSTSKRIEDLKRILREIDV